MSGRIKKNQKFPSAIPKSINTSNFHPQVETIYKGRQCNTPDTLSSRYKNPLEGYFWSARSRVSMSLAPSNRRLSFANHTNTSSTRNENKETSNQSLLGKYGRYLQGRDGLVEENSADFDEKLTCVEISHESSICQKASPRDSPYDIQMEELDSFYKRYSEIKVQNANFSNSKELLDSARENDETFQDRKITRFDVLVHNDQKQQKERGKIQVNKRVNQPIPPKHQTKPSIGSYTKKPSVLPMQILKVGSSGTEDTTPTNRIKKFNVLRGNNRNKENKDPKTLPPKTVINNYDAILRKYLDQKSKAKDLLTAKAPITLAKPIANRLRVSPNTTKNKENTPRNNKTLFIGNKDPLIIPNRTQEPYQTFIIPENPLITPKLISTKSPRVSLDAFNLKLKLRKPSMVKIAPSPSPFQTDRNRSRSNSKPRQTIVEPIIDSNRLKPTPEVPQTLKDLRFDQILGQGAYAVVKLAFNRASGRFFAVKTYEKYKLADSAKMKNVRREISLLKDFDHPNIIKLYSSIETPRQIHLVMEYIGKTSLYSYLKTKPQNKIEENELKRLFKQLCEGIRYCHEKQIVHRDIKLDNILLDDDKQQVKIIDFGFSVVTPPERRLSIFCGTPSYMAPEIVSKCQYRGSPSDIWSLGIVFYALLCGKLPFRGLDEKDLFTKIKKGKYDIPSHVSSEATEIIQKMLCIKPEDRVNISDVLF